MTKTGCSQRNPHRWKAVVNTSHQIQASMSQFQGCIYQGTPPRRIQTKYLNWKGHPQLKSRSLWKRREIMGTGKSKIFWSIRTKDFLKRYWENGRCTLWKTLGKGWYRGKRKKLIRSHRRKKIKWNRANLRFRKVLSITHQGSEVNLWLCQG